MSLLFTNKATLAQLAWLREHDYFGTLELTKSEAEQLINEYIEQERTEIPTRLRGFKERLLEYDPYYLERYKQIKAYGKE